MCLAVVGTNKLGVWMEADDGFRYCSEECQIKVWPTHKKDRKRVQREREKAEGAAVVAEKPAIS